MNAKKSIMTLALAALSASAAAQYQSEIEVGGKLHLSVDKIDDGSINGSNVNVSSNSSSLHVRASRGPVFGLVETLITAGGTGGGSGVQDVVGWGDTYLGVALPLGSMPLGSITLGRQTSPYAALGRNLDLFDSRVGDSRNLLSLSGADRYSNTVAINVTPAFSLLRGSVAYSTNINNGPAGRTGAGAANAMSAAASLDADRFVPGLKLSAAYEKHDKLGPRADDSDSAYRAGAQYKRGRLLLTALYQHEYDIGAQNNMTLTRDAYGVGAAYYISEKLSLRAQYYKTGGIEYTSNPPPPPPGSTSAPDSSASLVAAAVDYKIDRGTTLYLAFAKTKNSEIASYRATGGGHGDNPPAWPGSKTSAISAGVIYEF